MSLTIVGLGPGDGRMMTREAWETVTTAENLILRTSRHPAVLDFPEAVVWSSFDVLYESAERFGDVYAQIIDQVITQAKESDLVYAVPGHPFVGESTVLGIQERAAAAEIDVKIVDGMSFFGPCLAAVGADGMDGVQVQDAIELTTQDYPQLSPDRPVLLGQVYSRLLASDLKLLLNAMYPDEHPVFLIHGAGTREAIVEEIALFEIDHSDQIAHLTALYIPPLPKRSDLSALAEIVATLRGPNGCPWDQKQTPKSLLEGFIQEVYEVVEAIDEDDVDNLQEELGDVMLNIMMQIQMAQEDGLFTVSDVIGDIVEKIVRRHPHVWGEAAVDGSEQVLANWDEIKAAEKAGKPQPESALDGIPKALPALAKSQKLQKKAGKLGFEWPDIDGVYDKLQEEIEEVRSAETEAERLDEVGDLFFSAVNIARWLDVDAESALREANAKFIRRFKRVEQLSRTRSIDLNALDIDRLEALWQEAKAELAAES